MKKQKIKEIINDFYVPHKPLDFYIYIMLVLFLILVLITKANFYLTCLYAFVFSNIVFVIYILQLKVLRKFKNKYLEKIENINLTQLQDIITDYYSNKNYIVAKIDEKLQIEKNNNKYLVKFFINELNLENTLDSDIVVTNTILNKEQIGFLKKNKKYVISKYGLVDILKDYERGRKNK